MQLSDSQFKSTKTKRKQTFMVEFHVLNENKCMIIYMKLSLTFQRAKNVVVVFR